MVQRPYDEEDDAMFFTQDQKSRAATLKSEPAAIPAEFKVQSAKQAEARPESQIDRKLETRFETKLEAKPENKSDPREDMAARTFVVASADKASPAPAPAPAPAPVPASAPPPAPASGFAPHSAPQPTYSQVSNVSSGPSAGAAEINRKVAHAIKNLFDTVDTSIHGLTALGVEAMHEDDLAAVSSIMKQTKTLKGLRDGIVQLSKDWQKSLEE